MIKIFTLLFSVDKSQLIVNHNCKSQKDIDLVMSKIFEDLKSMNIYFMNHKDLKTKRKCL